LIVDLPVGDDQKIAKAKRNLFAFLRDTLNVPDESREALALEDLYTPIDRCLADGMSLRGRHSDVNLTMGIYSHVEVTGQSAAINSLPAPPPIVLENASHEKQPGPTNPSARQRRGVTDAKSVAPIVAPAFGFECLCLASAVADGQNESPDERKQKPLPKQGLASICRWLTADGASSGGGTRTPDTRIMIPLL
jgi:hypothetical protein